MCTLFILRAFSIVSRINNSHNCSVVTDCGSVLGLAEIMDPLLFGTDCI